jgi:hypothetical protein
VELAQATTSSLTHDHEEEAAVMQPQPSKNAASHAFAALSRRHSATKGTGDSNALIDAEQKEISRNPVPQP